MSLPPTTDGTGLRDIQVQTPPQGPEPARPHKGKSVHMQVSKLSSQESLPRKVPAARAPGYSFLQRNRKARFQASGSSAHPETEVR